MYRGGGPSGGGGGGGEGGVPLLCGFVLCQVSLESPQLQNYI